MNNEIISLHLSDLNLLINVLTYSKYGKYNARYFLLDGVAQYVGENRDNVESVMRCVVMSECTKRYRHF